MCGRSCSDASTPQLHLLSLRKKKKTFIRFIFGNLFSHYSVHVQQSHNEANKCKSQLCKEHPVILFTLVIHCLHGTGIKWPWFQLSKLFNSSQTLILAGTFQLGIQCFIYNGMLMGGVCE